MACVTVDTNILVRVVVDDDPAQSALARQVLDESESVAIPIMALCEVAWVLARSYRISLEDIAATIRRLTEVRNVIVDRSAVAAGLSVLDMGGDFADGVIAHEGNALGGLTFVSFDRGAVARLNMLGIPAMRPS